MVNANEACCDQVTRVRKELARFHAELDLVQQELATRTAELDSLRRVCEHLAHSVREARMDAPRAGSPAPTNGADWANLPDGQAKAIQQSPVGAAIPQFPGKGAASTNESRVQHESAHRRSLSQSQPQTAAPSSAPCAKADVQAILQQPKQERPRAVFEMMGTNAECAICLIGVMNMPYPDILWGLGSCMNQQENRCDAASYARHALRLQPLLFQSPDLRIPKDDVSAGSLH